MALLSRFEQDGIHRCKRLVSALVPVLPGCLNLGPVAVDPAFEHSQRFGERVGECRQLIQRGGFDAAGVEVTNDEAVSRSALRSVSVSTLWETPSRVSSRS